MSYVFSVCILICHFPVFLFVYRYSLAVGPEYRITLSGSVELTFPRDNCLRATYFCIHLTTGTNAAYVDANTHNNVACTPFDHWKICEPGWKSFCNVIELLPNKTTSYHQSSKRSKVEMFPV